LKRRAGTAGINASAESAHEIIGAEPPLKKFKSLFDESDPDRLSQTVSGILMEADIQPSPGEAQILPADGTQSLQRVLVPSILRSAEDVEEGTMSTQAVSQVRGFKRKTDRLEDDHDDPQKRIRPTKRQTLGNLAGDDINAQQFSPSQQPPAVCVPQGQSQTPSLAHAAHPDVDHHFLKAIASMRKGKKNEDSFDREFNNLRISKPDLRQEDREKEWSILEDFGDERNIRGNFMVVVEMEVSKKGDDRGVPNRGTGRDDWEGKPDFKKFRKVSALVRPSYTASEQEISAAETSV
jgi:hypothetical protein